MHPKFAKHPYKFIALACLSESLFYTMKAYNNFICTADFPYWLTLSLNYPFNQETHFTNEKILNSMILLAKSQKYMETLGIIMSVAFNGIVYIDLYLTLKNPFFPR